jgi:hypothetical protein
VGQPAVGIIDGEHNPANLMFFGVVAMGATAAAMAAVAVVIVAAGWNPEAWLFSACNPRGIEPCVVRYSLCATFAPLRSATMAIA